MSYDVKFVFSQRFMPLFLTQFFGASNDNFLKNAMLVMFTYQLGNSAADIGALSNLAAAMFILPYFLFSTLAGQFADKFDRAKYSRMVKIVEIVLMIAAGAAFIFSSVPLLLIILFFMGAQSTFFSPAKYSLLPAHLHGRELIAGNAWINGGTYIAILAGAMAGGLTIAAPDGHLWCGVTLIICALIGYFASCRIPPTPSADPHLKIDWNFFRQTIMILRQDVWRQKPVRCCVFAVSVFWLAGSLYITQLPLLTRYYVHGSEAVCTMFFVLFALGVGIGSFFADLLFRHGIKFRIIMASLLLMGIFTADLALIVWTHSPGTQVLPFTKLCGTFLFYRASFDLLAIAVTGGIWSVPLNAVMQNSSRPEVLARVIAGGNIINSFYMTAGAVCVAALMQCGIDTGSIFAALGVIIIGTVPLIRVLSTTLTAEQAAKLNAVRS